MEGGEEQETLRTPLLCALAGTEKLFILRLSLSNSAQAEHNADAYNAHGDLVIFGQDSNALL